MLNPILSPLILLFLFNTFNAFTINYLESTDPTNFLTEANDWAISNAVCPGCSQTFTIPPNSCGFPEEILYGGPNILGPLGQSTNGQSLRRYYPNLPNIGQWRPIEFDVYMFYDTPPTTTQTITDLINVSPGASYYQGGALKSVCSLDYSDNAQGIVIKSIYYFRSQSYIWITDASQSISIGSLLSFPSTVRSFGIRNVKLYQYNTLGQVSPLNFPCFANSYWTGSYCGSCGSPCASCTASNPYNCTSCRDFAYTYQNNSCLGSCSGPFESYSKTGSTGQYCREKCPNSFYFVSNGNCISSCEPPLIQAVDQNNITVCNNPCYSMSSWSYQYRFPDGSCSFWCSHSTVPMTTHTDVYTCVGPCSNSSNYYFQNSTCGSECPSPLVASSPVGVRTCNSPCPNKYIFYNASCESTCPFPLISEEYGTIKYCHNPCQNSPDGPFLFSNQSCKHNCPLPLLTKNDPYIQFCINPCQPSEYLFDNSQCLTDCISPLVKQIEPDVKYCRNPCYGTNKFLYPNGSCIKTCPFPLNNRTEPGVKYCENPCSLNHTFLYDNQSCFETCPYPNIMKNESVANFCRFPCSNPSYYFYTTDESCKKTCPYPYEAFDFPLPKLCTSELSEEEIRQIKKLADTTDTANSASSTGALIWSVVSSSDSTAACMGPIAKMLQYIRWMNISFPPKVQLMLDQQNIKANTPGFTQKIAKPLLATFPDHDLPGRFQTYKIPSSFFVNFWPALFNLSVIFLVTLLVILITMSSKRSLKLHAILYALMNILKWNVVLVTFCGSLGDIVLFTALEFHTARFENAQSVVSFGLCLLMNGLSVFIVVQILEVNLSIRKSMQKISGNDLEKQKQKIEQEWVSYKSFFECYRDHSYFQQIFLFIFVIRLGVFNGIIGYLYKYPLFQAITITLMNIIMLLYLIIKRPMRKLFSLIQQIILELVMLPFNFSVLVLAVMDHREIEEPERRKKIGDVIVYINVIIPVLSLALMACKFLVIGYDFYKIWKLRKAGKLNNGVKTREPSQSRHQGITLHTNAQENDTTQTLHTQSYHDKNTMEGTQVFDFHENNISISPEISNMSSTSPLYLGQRAMRPENLNPSNQPQGRNILQHQRAQQFLTINHMEQNDQVSSLGRMDWESPGNDRRRIKRRKNKLQNQNSMRPAHEFRRGQKEHNIFKNGDLIF